jgi:hypothetical protein
MMMKIMRAVVIDEIHKTFIVGGVVEWVDYL